MNLRIAENHLKFKITKGELKALRRGESLQQQVGFPGAELRVSIEADDRAPGLAPIYDAGEGYLRLPVSPGQLQALEEPGRHRAGLSQRNGDTLTVLQVDVRRQKDPR